jgi:hypothetical protein
VRKPKENRGDTDDDLPLPIILLLKALFLENKKEEMHKEKVSYEVKKTGNIPGGEEHDEEERDIINACNQYIH